MIYIYIYLISPSTLKTRTPTFHPTNIFPSLFPRSGSRTQGMTGKAARIPFPELGVPDPKGLHLERPEAKARWPTSMEPPEEHPGASGPNLPVGRFTFR